MTAQDSLRHLAALSHFSLDQFEQLAQATSVVNLPAGSMLVERGTESANIYGLTRGAVTVQRSTVNGDFVLARLKPGELLGETNFIDPATRSTDIIAADDCELVTLDADKLNELVAADQRFELALYWAIWNSAAKKLRITNRMLGHFFATHEPGASPTSVGEPKRGAPVPVDIATKRDLFLRFGLSLMEANFLASLSKAERFESTETVFLEGQKGERLYFILSGEIRISKVIPGAGEEALAILGAGEVFGEMALVDGRPRSADAVAHEGPVEVLVVKAEILSRLLDIEKLSSPRLLKVLCKTVARRLRTLDDKIIGWYMLSGGDTTLIGGHEME